MPYFDIFCCHIDPRTWSHILAKIFPFKGPQAMELGKTPGPRATSKAKLLLLGGPGATARPKFSISLGPRATTPSQIIVVRGTWSRSPAQIFNLNWTWSRCRAKIFNHPGTSSHNPKPNYCSTVDLEPQTGQTFNLPGTWSLNPKPNYFCTRDLEPQPSKNFQSSWDLQPQPQAKLLLYRVPGAAAWPKFSIPMGPGATTPSQIIVVRGTWSCSALYVTPGAAEIQNQNEH
jgi:hypothetical protein